MFAAARAMRVVQNVALPEAGAFVQQTRNTFILRRRWPPPLHKKGGRPSKMRGRHFVYDLVEDTHVTKKPDLSIVLKQYVEGVGNEGDVVSMRPNAAYRRFLVPGLAVYATPENISKYNKAPDAEKKPEEEHSSPFAQRTVNCLSRLVLQIIMNKNETWELQPWHVRASFRKAGFVVPEHAIQMPSAKICGPDLSLQNKEFFVTVTVNNKEKVNVRCRIHHWATGLERLPHVHEHWKLPVEPLFAEQADILQEMTLPK